MGLTLLEFAGGFLALSGGFRFGFLSLHWAFTAALHFKSQLRIAQKRKLDEEEEEEEEQILVLGLVTTTKYGGGRSNVFFFLLDI